MATSFVYRPDYTIKEYGHGLYKLIKFKRCDYVSFADHEHDRPSDVKLDPRSRGPVCDPSAGNLQEWDYFFTGTLNGAWHDRRSLPGLSVNLRSLSVTCVSSRAMSLCAICWSQSVMRMVTGIFTG